MDKVILGREECCEGSKLGGYEYMVEMILDLIIRDGIEVEKELVLRIFG